MLKHVLMFKLNNYPDPEKQKKLEEICHGLNSLPDLIPDIKNWEIGTNISNSPAAYDLFLYSEFADTDALERYRIHPAHQQVVSLIQEYCADRVVVDYQS